MRAWWCSAVLALVGCEGFGLPTKYDGPDKKVFFSIGDPQPGVPTGTFQDALDGWSYLIDISDPEDPKYECQHTDEEMRVKAELHDFPTASDLSCMVPTQAEDAEPDPEAPPAEPQDPQPAPFPAMHTGVPGMNPLPPGQEGWRGADKGGCGVWATAMCNRRLGITDPTTHVTEAEWNEIATAIKLSDEGGSNHIDEAAYYRSKGYCTVDEIFYGTEEEYQKVQDALSRCDVKLSMFRVEGEDVVDGHVETIIESGSRNLITNSWGAKGAVQGGYDGSFQHWKNGKQWRNADGSLTYPPDDTITLVSYVCPCDHPMMETWGQLILRTVTGG